MSEIKVRYVAQIVIDAHFPRLRNVLPIEEINENVRETLTKNIHKVLANRIVPSVMGTVEITEQFIDVYETEEES